MRLDQMLEKVLDVVKGDDSEEQARDRNVRPATEDPYGDPADQGYQQAGQYPGGVMPASQDPYGDPADQYQGQQVLSSSQDPYGDPADEMHGQQVLSASEDPYGDPADEETAPSERRRWPF